MTTSHREPNRPPETPAEVDAYLRAHGFDPEEIGRTAERMARQTLQTMAGVMLLQAAVREKRERESLALRDAAPLIGCTFTTLGRFERGYGVAELTTVVACARWCGVSLDELFGLKTERGEADV